MRNHQATEGVDDLLTVKPSLGAEWDYEMNVGLNPRRLKLHANKPAWWRCDKGHSWQAMINHRTKGKGSGCPYCSGRFAIEGENDLVTVNPALASEWDYEKNVELNPHKLKPCSNKYAWWRCAKGHSWVAMIAVRTHGTGCPYCAGCIIQPGINDITTLFPLVAAEWYYQKNGEMKPADVGKGSHKRVWWKADCGHSWIATVYHRCRDDGLATGCPYCSGKKILTGFNDLATLNPQLASEWNYGKNNGITPNTVSPGSHKKYWWNGDCGHTWCANIYDRSQGTGCPYCRNLKVLIGFNDLAYLQPNIAAEWAYEKNGSLRPTDVTPGTERFVWWRYEKGHLWRSKISTRSMGTHCPKCNGQQKMKLRLVR